MKKYVVPILFLISGFLLGDWFGWQMHKAKYENEQTMMLESINTNAPANASFRASALAGMTKLVEDGELDVFYNLACLEISGELSDINDFLASNPIEGRGFNLRVIQAQSRLIELKEAGKCEQEI